ncbi:TPA: tail assembly protein, partial [Klebsiella pneumoniae]
KASYGFGGVTNTASQGYPVPLLYGKRRIGGAIISAGIYVEDQQ